MLALYIQLQELAVRYRRDSRGVTAMEYGLIASLIAVVIISGVSLLGTNLGNTFSSIAGKMAVAP